MSGAASTVNFFAGVDEAGRGPLAGPIAVAAVCAISRTERPAFFGEVKDSKQLSAQKRREILGEIKKAREHGVLAYSFAFVGHETIDRKGIDAAARLGVARALSKLSLEPSTTHVLLDGGLRAPGSYPNQTTIIRGDEKEYLVALASVVAKVLRDEKMERLGRKYPHYSFEQHKGYGTKEHFKLIKKYKLSPIHRRSYVAHCLQTGAARQ